MKKILVIRMSAIGDIVLATSFLESVKQKYPDSEIHFLIKKEFSDFVKKHPIIDKLISFDKKLGLKSLSILLEKQKHFLLFIYLLSFLLFSIYFEMKFFNQSLVFKIFHSQKVGIMHITFSFK